jgi:hypothetical protein
VRDSSEGWDSPGGNVTGRDLVAMLNRLKWILLSHASRPMVLTMLGLACLLYAAETFREPVFKSLAEAYKAPKASNAAAFSVSGVLRTLRVFGNFFRILWPCLVVAVAVGTQLSCQFRGPSCRVLPKFASPHFVIAGVLSIVAVALGTVRLVSAGGPFLPSISVAMVAAACGITISSRAVLAGSSTSQFGFASTVAHVALITTILCLSLSNFSEPVSPFMTLSLAAISMAVITMGVRALLQLSSVPSERAVFDREGILQQTWQGMRLDESIFGTGTGEPLLAKLPPGDKKPTLWQRVERWRVGNLPKANRRLAIAIVAIFSTGPFLISGSLRPSALVVRDFLILGAIIVAGVGLARTATIWRARLLVLSTEIFRPVGKRALMREWMAAIVKDVLPSVLLSTITLAFAINLRPNYGVNWLGFAQYLIVVFPAMFVWSLGFVGTIIVVQRNWVALLIVMADYLSPEARSFPVNYLLLAILTLPSAVLCALLARQWFRMEIGTRQ